MNVATVSWNASCLRNSWKPFATSVWQAILCHAPGTRRQSCRSAPHGAQDNPQDRAGHPAGSLTVGTRRLLRGAFRDTHTGEINGPIYEYDIRSAYPAAMLQLPCLAHGRWSRYVELSKCNIDAHTFYVCRAEFKHPMPQQLCGLPVRTGQGRSTGHDKAAASTGLAKLALRDASCNCRLS